MSTPFQRNSTPSHISHRCIIENISYKFSETFIRGYPCFTYSTTSTSSTPEFHLCLYPKGATSDLKNYLSVGLTLVGEPGSIDEPKLVVRCQFSLIDSEERKCNTKEFSYCFTTEKPCLMVGQFITKSDLLNTANGFVHDDKLTLDCQITVLGEPSSVGYFDSFLSDLCFIAKSNPDLMVELFHDLALEHKDDELPDRVLLELPAPLVPLEETMSHRAKCCIISTLTFTNGFDRLNLWPINIPTKPLLKFRVYWSPRFQGTVDFSKRYYVESEEYELMISYRSTPKIFVDFSVACEELCPNVNWDPVDPFSCRYESNMKIHNFSQEFSSKSRNFKHIFIRGSFTSFMTKEFSLKMTVSKESIRKFEDFPEIKSLSSEQLLFDLKSMLKGGKHCDVTLFVEGKQLRAHKSILVARSIFLEVLFDLYEWKDKVKNRVEIDDVKVHVFEQLMLYLYTGKVDFEFLRVHAMDLYVLAEMHLHSTLSQMCLRGFGQSLTPKSVYEQSERANRLGLIEFKQVCTDFMNKSN